MATTTAAVAGDTRDSELLLSKYVDGNNVEPMSGRIPGDNKLGWKTPQSLENRASQALLSHVNLPPERGSDGPSTVNICRAPISPSIVMLTAVTFPSPSPSCTPSTVVGPSAQIFFVAMYCVCPIGSLEKN